MSPSKSAITRQAIIDSACEFLQTRPFRDLSVGGLMKATKYSRATFYQHFNDLHALMEALLDEVKVGIVEGAMRWLDQSGESVEDLTHALSTLVDVSYDRGMILRAVSDAAASDERLDHVWESFLRAFDELVSARIAADQKVGLIPDFDPFPVARALNRMDAGLLINAFGRAPKSDKDDVLAAILRVWLSTLYPISAEDLLKPKK